MDCLKNRDNKNRKDKALRKAKCPRIDSEVMLQNSCGYAGSVTAHGLKVQGLKTWKKADG